jgi:ABC-2 type transport system ATP-binding protein
MKMELIASLLHQPRVLFLDEPTIGLDVISQKTVRNFLREHNSRRKTTILLTSHYMADIEELCRRVIIIDHGSIFFDGKLSEVIDRFADFKLITIQCEPGSAVDRALLDDCGVVVEQTPVQIKLKVKRERVIAVCKRLLDVLPVTDIDIQEVPIEDIIRQLFARERGTAA